MAPLPRDRDKLFRMEQAVRVLLYGLGEDLNREGLLDTPKRVAKALLDCTQGYNQDTSSTLGTALFHEPIVHQGGEGVVIVRDIDFASTSEETLLPFHGRCHVAYRPKDGVVLGLSKLARLTKQYAKRLQTQERLAAAIALALQQSLECHGVAVVLQARHMSNSALPEERTNACVSGVFAVKGSAALEELLALLGLEHIPEAAIAKLHCSASSAMAQEMDSADAGAVTAVDPGVPVPGTPDNREDETTDGDSDDLVLEPRFSSAEMETAVQQLLLELGENPHRPGLVGSARRYVMSLLTSTSGYHMQLPQLWGEPMPGALLRPLLQPQAQELQEGHQLLQQQRGQHLELQQQQQRLACMQGRPCGQVLNGVGAADRAPAGAGLVYVPSGACPAAWAVGCSGKVGNGTDAPGRHASDVGVDGHSGCVNGSVAAGACRHANGSGVARVPCGALADSYCSVTAATATRGAGCCAQTARCRLQARCASVRAADGALATTGPLRGAVTLCLPFTSQCEHHMLPFYGEIMVAYFPGGTSRAGHTVLPYTAIEQVVCMYTQRLQVQERITHQVADAVEVMLRTAASVDALAAGPPQSVPSPHAYVCNGGGHGNAVQEGAEEQAMGVMVVCDAAHMCMVARGVENHSGSTTSFAVRGVFEEHPEMRRAVLRLFREHARA